MPGSVADDRARSHNYDAEGARPLPYIRRLRAGAGRIAGDPMCRSAGYVLDELPRQLRQVEWSRRHHPGSADDARFLAIAEAVLAGCQARGA
jgi:hypothetical protein